MQSTMFIHDNATLITVANCTNGRSTLYQTPKNLLLFPTDHILSIFRFLKYSGLCKIQLLNKRGYRLLDYGSTENVINKLPAFFHEFILNKILAIPPDISLSNPSLHEHDSKHLAEESAVKANAAKISVSNAQHTFILKNGTVIAFDKADTKKELWKCALDHQGQKEFYGVNNNWLIVASIYQNQVGERWYDEKYSMLDSKTGEVIHFIRQRGNKKLQGWLNDNLFFYVDRDERLRCCYLPASKSFNLFNLSKDIQINKIQVLNHEICIQLVRDWDKSKTVMMRFSLDYYKSEKVGKPAPTSKKCKAILSHSCSPNLKPSDNFHDIPHITRIELTAAAVPQGAITTQFSLT